MKRVLVSCFCTVFSLYFSSCLCFLFPFFLDCFQVSCYPYVFKPLCSQCLLVRSCPGGFVLVVLTSVSLFPSSWSPFSFCIFVTLFNKGSSAFRFCSPSSLNSPKHYSSSLTNVSQWHLSQCNRVRVQSPCAKHNKMYDMGTSHLSGSPIPDTMSQVWDGWSEVHWAWMCLCVCVQHWKVCRGVLLVFSPNIQCPLCRASSCIFLFSFKVLASRKSSIQSWKTMILCHFPNTGILSSWHPKQNKEKVFPEPRRAYKT